MFPEPQLTDRGQPQKLTDSTGKNGYVGACWQCARTDVQVLKVGCVTTSHAYYSRCGCESWRWVCLTCWWRSWR